MAQTPGIMFARWGSANIPLEKGATYKAAGLKANPVNIGRETNHSMEYQEGRAKGTTVLKKGQRFTDLYQTGENELILTLDTGQVFTHQAILTETPELNSDGGKVPLEWFFGPGKES
jgi:hypothetical protein